MSPLINVLLVVSTTFLVSKAGAAPSEACPFTSAEVAAVLGAPVDDGKGTTTPFAGGKLLSCDYRGKGKLSLVFSQTKTASAADAAQIAKGLPGQALSGDPDAAVWVQAMGNAFRVTLSYVRGAAHTEVSVVGVDSRNAAEADPLRARLKALRRLP